MIPLVYGQCRVRSPVMVWSGNYVKPGDSGPGGTAIVFSLDALLAVGVPFFNGRAELITGGWWYGDIRYGAIAAPRIGSDAFDFVATISGSPFASSFVGEFYPGSIFQSVRESVSKTKTRMVLAGINSTLIPGYASTILVACVGNTGGTDSGLVTGTTATIGSLSFEIRASSINSSSDMGVTGWSAVEDADPAAVVYDLITAPWGRAALPPSKIDTTSFIAASTTLLAEGHGYSRSIEQTDDALSLINDVLRQIDGVVYEEPTTGQLELHLIRADYSVPGLVDINPNNAVLTEYTVQGQSETFNQVRLIYTNRSGQYNDAVMVAQNQANVVNQGGKLRSTDIRFVGCCTAGLANTLAARELAAVSLPQAKIAVDVNRSFYQARPGGLFTFTWPELNISGMVVRVVSVNLGQPNSGSISMVLMRDIYAQTLGAFPQP